MTQSPRGEGILFIPTAELWDILARLYKMLDPRFRGDDTQEDARTE